MLIFMTGAAEHRKRLINQILDAASPEERRAGQAFLIVGDHGKAVDLLLMQEEIFAPSRVEWKRRHNSYRVAMTRLRHRGRRLLGDDAVL